MPRRPLLVCAFLFGADNRISRISGSVPHVYRYNTITPILLVKPPLGGLDVGWICKVTRSWTISYCLDLL